MSVRRVAKVSKPKKKGVEEVVTGRQYVIRIVAHAQVDDYKEEKLADGTTELTTIWSKI